MPLPNRVDPLGQCFATPLRGAFMGNRGGRIHDPDTREPTGRLQAARQWICCRLAFKGRQRKVWGESYTELFFRDETSALAAGHRPCFECRREAATAFALAWGSAKGIAPPSAPEMDRVLDGERREGRRKRLHIWPAAELPDGAMIMHEGHPHTVAGDTLLRWEFAAHAPSTVERHRRGDAVLITPPSIVQALLAGYRPDPLVASGCG